MSIFKLDKKGFISLFWVMFILITLTAFVIVCGNIFTGLANMTKPQVLQAFQDNYNAQLGIFMVQAAIKANSILLPTLLNTPTTWSTPIPYPAYVGTQPTVTITVTLTDTNTYTIKSATNRMVITATCVNGVIQSIS